ncbi:DNA-binding transcriptional MerR regulator [Silvibacterium bohemicum]|uniref:DNA-binding transcriptional MerR regulator n=1 Tax=Silvibacterium bohemicum TaxID=1577686 RepID=A0A841JU85_9BACT|nr:MerR family transcriptional regulator [Silvibacterium bohemicum]MBB6144952.1 DNA-binding transcriptional MerR regulator [Silvibacterium bohemicum]
MLKIGDFSTLAQVSIKTLRFYDQMGLLLPASIDSNSGYRYYSADQLSRLHRILALKDFGFTLEQIGQALDAGVTGEQMRGMLLLRKTEQEQRVEEELERLGRLNSRIRLIEQEASMANEVILKTAPKQWIASVRETISAYNTIGPLYLKLSAALGPAMAACQFGVALWHDPEFKESDVDAEAGFYFKENVPAADGVSVYELPETTVASAMHNGSYQRLPEAYDGLLRWVAENGYSVAGPIRELYLKISMPVRQDDESYVTEIQVPVRKSA